MIKLVKLLLSVFPVSFLLFTTFNTLAAEGPVGITSEIFSVDVMHEGKKFTIKRNQNNKNKINSKYALTSRPCPKFCIQPAVLAPGVDTIAELEVLDYLKKMAAGDKNILVIDSRTPDWVKRGTIPGAINIPWTSLNASKADAFVIADIVTSKFNAKEKGEGFDFTNAKTLVMFCNGMWCGQSPNNIKSLLALGYPANKIKWYRGGMQDWEVLGLSTVSGK